MKQLKWMLYHSQFWYLSLPQLVDIICSILAAFIWTFNKFDDIFLLTGGAAGTRTVDVYEQAFAVSSLGAGAAVAVVVFVVLLSFAICSNSHLRTIHNALWNVHF